MPIDLQKVNAWMSGASSILKQADAIFGTPLVRLAVVPLLKAMLPPLGVTPEQIATLDAHHEDLTAREAEARRRARGDV